MAANGKGALFKNDNKKTEKHPDYTGNFTLTRELLQAYADHMGSASEMKINIAGWIATPAKGGTKYIQLNVNAPFENRQDGPRVPKTNPFGNRQQSAPDDESPF